ncbi:MAG: MFS transporter [Candidatus Dormibacteraeota bacterium]|nr:MFS transporter [Candidatus Dormibacteraeota bacterium]
MSVFYARQLDRYPVRGRRILLLLMAVIATLVGSYEAQISPVLPLMLKALAMPLATYGLIAGASVVVGAVAAGASGPLADRWGRVTLLVPSLFLTGVCDFAMLLVRNPGDLLLLRCVLSFIEGFAATTTAGLVRDFSPRMGRATAYGFWTWGPVGANYMAAAIAGLTLPIFLTWQSQFVIMGSISIVLTVIVAFNIRDLSPALRAKVIHTEAEGVALGQEAGQAEVGKVREILSHPRIWAHALGMTSWLVLYETLVFYGPTMLVQSFHITAASAATVMSYFWILNLGSLIVAGYVSDRLRLRKPVSLFGGICSTIVMAFLIARIGVTSSAAEIGAIGAVLGMFLGVTYAPWMAMFSENLEDVRPSLQATGWGLWGFCVRAMIVVMVIVAPLIVAGTHGWQTWLIIATVFEAAYLPVILAFKGPWRRSALEPSAQPTVAS